MLRVRCGGVVRESLTPRAALFTPGLSGLVWGALAVVVVFGVLAMHSLAGGHHAVHLDPPSSTSGEASRHAGHETEPVLAGAVVLAAVVRSSEQAAACGTSGCGAEFAGVVCLALLLGLVLATIARRVGMWPACPLRTNAVANAALDRRVGSATPSLRQLGISRT